MHVIYGCSLYNHFNFSESFIIKWISFTNQVLGDMPNVNTLNILNCTFLSWICRSLFSRAKERSLNDCGVSACTTWRPSPGRSTWGRERSSPHQKQKREVKQPPVSRQVRFFVLIYHPFTMWFWVEMGSKIIPSSSESG